MRYREMRIPCDTEIVVTLGDEVRRARFVNISPSGARLTGLGQVPEGAVVTLRHLGRSWIARVAWCRDGQVGLRFPVSLSDGEIGFLRGTSARTGVWAPSAAPRFRELS